MRHYVLLDKPVCPYFTGKAPLITSHQASVVLSAITLGNLVSSLGRLGTQLGLC
jgi:uncharacterized protein YejL (UPF0352 family)